MRKLFQQVKQTAQEVNLGVRNAFRGVLNVVKSGSPIQQAQVSGLADETLQDVELMQQFGFTSVPPAGTEVVILPLGGKTTHGIIVATENGAFRVANLKSGEVAIYDQSGGSIVLKSGKLIEVNCDQFAVNASQKIALNSPLVEAQSDIQAGGNMGAGGNINANGDVSAGAVSLSSHKHNEQGDGKPTSAPIS